MKSMIGGLLLGAFLFFSVCVTWKEAYGNTIDCKKNPVACHIIRVSPKTPNAMELSNRIAEVGKRFGVSPHLIVAVAMQESGLRDVNRVIGVTAASGLRLHVTDYGILQVNEHSVAAYGLNADLLSWNRDYQLWAGVLILNDKIKTFGDWAAYHSITPRHNRAYRALVGRYL
jgi:hypothetical protein